MKALCAMIVIHAVVAATARAQGTVADYQRADSFAARARNLVIGVADQPSWIGQTARFWYRRSVAGGHQFVVVDPERRRKAPAFDHARLAHSLSAMRKDTVRDVTLPFNRFTFV